MAIDQRHLLKHFKGIRLEGISDSENARIFEAVEERFLRVCENYFDVADSRKLAVLTALDILIPDSGTTVCPACGSRIFGERRMVLIDGMVLRVYSKGFGDIELKTLAARVEASLAAHTAEKSGKVDSARLAFGVAMSFSLQAGKTGP